MSDKSRAWFQIHLLTAIVMMFVAGGLIWANVEGKKGRLFVPSFDLDHNMEVAHIYGWPCPFSEYMTDDENKKYNGFGDWVGVLYLVPAFAFNLICWCSILGAAYVACEFVINRRSSLLENPN